MDIKENCPNCFKALSITVRAKIYGLLLRHKKMSVSDIVNEFDLTQPTISYHLKEMEKARLIKSERFGRRMVYSIESKCLYGDNACLIKPSD